MYLCHYLLQRQSLCLAHGVSGYSYADPALDIGADGLEQFASV